MEASRKVGRPRKVDAASSNAEEVKPVENARPRRSSMDGNFRDKLTVRNADPNYVYRWCLDSDTQGANIHFKKECGWEIVSSEMDVGEASANNPNPGGGGGPVRVPSGEGNKSLFLMRIRKEWYEEDQELKAEKIRKTDRVIHGSRYDANGETLYSAKVDGAPSRRELVS